MEDAYSVPFAATAAESVEYNPASREVTSLVKSRWEEAIFIIETILSLDEVQLLQRTDLIMTWTWTKWNYSVTPAPLVVVIFWSNFPKLLHPGTLWSPNRVFSVKPFKIKSWENECCGYSIIVVRQDELTKCFDLSSYFSCQCHFKSA